MKKAAEELDVMKLPDDERRRYESYIEDRRCAESSIETSWLEGHEKGIEKGIEHGEKNKNIENVKNMKDLGVASEIIIQVTGMKKEEIENVV